jgi:hypothetical protein
MRLSVPNADLFLRGRQRSLETPDKPKRERQLKLNTIQEIHEHLKAGHEVALCTYTRVTVLDARHVDTSELMAMGSD